jgi:hypothetical protein
VCGASRLHALERGGVFIRFVPSMIALHVVDRIRVIESDGHSACAIRLRIDPASFVEIELDALLSEDRENMPDDCPA